MENSSIEKRRQGKFTAILEILANSEKNIDFTKLTRFSPFLNMIIENPTNSDLSYKINNEDFFSFLTAGLIKIHEAENIREITLKNENATNVKIKIEVNNKITLFELEKLKAGVMEYAKN